MHNFFVCLIVGFCVFMLGGCTSSDSSEQKLTASRTVLVYIATENSLAGQGFAKKNIQDMITGAKKLSDNSNLLVFVDAPKENSKMYRIDKNGQHLVKDFGENLLSTDPNVFDSIVGYAEQHYPSKEYGLVLWSHADGWAPASKSNPYIQRYFGIDNNVGSDTSNDGVEMNIEDMALALSKYPKFKFIFSDACFMQTAEVAYDLRHVADYLVASPCEIPGPGAPYDLVVPAMFAEPLAVDSIASAYYNGYIKNYKNSTDYGVVLSVLDCSKIDDFVNITSSLLPQYNSSVTYNVDSLLTYRSYTNSAYCPYYDMKGEMKQILSSSDYSSWLAALNAMIVYKISTPTCFTDFNPAQYITIDQNKFSGISGYVSHFYPNTSNWNKQFYTTSWYSAAGWKQKGW